MNYKPSPAPPSLRSDLSKFSGGNLFSWQDPNSPTAKNGAKFSKSQMQGMFEAVMALPYKGVWEPQLQEYIIEDDYIGLTNGEVVAMKLTELAVRGDMKAINQILDRMLGKPKQQTESVKMTMGLTEYLEAMAQEEAQNNYGVVVDVPTQSTPFTGQETANQDDLFRQLFQPSTTEIDVSDL